MKSKTKRIALTATLVLVVIGYPLLLWRGPWWFDGAHLRAKDLQPADGVVITGFRTMLVALGAGTVAALGLHYTHKSHKQTEALFDHTREKDREQAELTREGQVTERYVEAVKLLASGNSTERLGGIYLLARIMRDSEKDRRTVRDVLAAFIREKCPVPPPDEAAEWGSSEHQVAADVQAALVALGRSTHRDEGGDYLEAVDLRGVNLIHLTLRYSYLRSALLDGANAREADLSGVSLYGAHLRGARLVGAQLSEADMRHARLDGANLTRANLAGTSLDYASFQGALLDEADLTEVNLRNAVGLEADMLCQAILTSNTRLPAELAKDSRIVERIAVCEASGK
ncbi:pentapeptide repeat-containing protein [Streptomyces sp. NPDC087437]|uniref:pentapeptide repeat-containing protein n=1 Tax=Streptomyces sp. NPDC087437 TaxID=3365789 RepID=UPI0037FAB825